VNGEEEDINEKNDAQQSSKELWYHVKLHHIHGDNGRNVEA